MKKNCIFFQNGQCKKGDNCDFLHNLNGSQNTENPNPQHFNKGNKVCLYYQKGNCKNGNSCEYIHQQQQAPINSNVDTGFPSNATICPFFLKGYCKNEDNCK